MMAPVRKRAMQHMLPFGHDDLIKIAYIWLFVYIEFNLIHALLLLSADISAG